uniref:RNase H type-1 domain-containing protein n=1 Tax=Opuntia streptacantha TaxID=393608 RepID=A0A7C9CFW3_OPUST
MRDGISAALQAGFRHLEVEGDNQIVLKAVQKTIPTPWQITPIIEDIWNLLSHCASYYLRHIYREGNLAADWMAKHGSLLRCHSLSLFSSPPPSWLFSFYLFYLNLV